jgi:hypothetical protein
MDFQGRYQILEMLSDGEARTFKALQTSSGRIVLLHQLWEERTPPHQPDLASLVFGFLRRATAEEMKSLLDMGEEASRVFVVTEDLPGCQDLRQWLQSAPGTPGTVGKASVPKSAPRGDSSAIAAARGLVSQARQEDLASPDATQLFTTPKFIAGQTLSASTEKPASTPTTHPELPVGPGTFASPDKLAGHLGGLSEAEVLKAAEPPVALSPPSREKGDPGEFTRMFLSSPGASKVHPAAQASADSRKAELPPQTAPEPPQGKDEPGEFSGAFFAAPPATKSPELTGSAKVASQEFPSIPAPPGPPPASQEAPSEFTRIFFSKDMPVPEAAGPVSSPPEKPSAPPAPRAEKPPERQRPAGFEVVYESRKQQPRGPAPPAVEKPLPPPPPAPGGEEGAPGDFSRIFYGRDESKALPPSPGPTAERTRLPSLAPDQPSQSEGAGELTRLFQAQHLKEKPPAAPSVEVGQTRSFAPPVRPSAQEGSGDFMRRYPTGGAETREVQPPFAGPSPELGSPAKPAASAGPPGTFTQLFQVPPQPKSPSGEPPRERSSQFPPPPPSAVESEGPGEFTRLFHAGPQPTRPGGPPIPTSSPRPPVPMSSSPSQQEGPGELTQLIRGYQPQKSGPTPPVFARPEPVVPPPPPTADKAKPGEFTMIFQRPSEPTTPPPPAVLSPPVVQTPPTAPRSPEPDEYMRMFELPGGGAGAPPQGAPQAPPPAASQPGAGRPRPVIPMVSVSPPMAPSMPYVQPPMVPQPQPYQIPAPQFQQPAVPSAFAMPPQPVMPQVQPMAVPVPVAPQVAPPKTGKSKFLVPLIILAGLFLIAVGLIFFFALKH